MAAETITAHAMDRIEIGFKCGLVKDKFDKFKNDTIQGKNSLDKGRFAQCLSVLLRMMKDTNHKNC